MTSRQRTNGSFYSSRSTKLHFAVLSLQSVDFSRKQACWPCLSLLPSAKSPSYSLFPKSGALQPHPQVASFVAACYVKGRQHALGTLARS